MPVYEYRCAQGHLFDLVLPIREYLVPQSCYCGSRAEKLILTPPRVFSDYDGYESPATGKWIEGRVARERDLREAECVPYEAGMREDMARKRAEGERKLDASIDSAVESTLHEMLA